MMCTIIQNTIVFNKFFFYIDIFQKNLQIFSTRKKTEQNLLTLAIWKGSASVVNANI